MRCLPDSGLLRNAESSGLAAGSLICTLLVQGECLGVSAARQCLLFHGIAAPELMRNERKKPGCNSLFFCTHGTKKNFNRSMLIRLPLPQCFFPRERKLRPWSEKNSDQNSDHPRLCIYWGNEKLRPWSEFLGRENSDHVLSFGCFWGRGR